jgi:lysozyme
VKISNRGINLIKNFEGLRLWAYKCSGGVWTIGYGHTGPDVKQGDFISLKDADLLFLRDLERFEKAVNKFVKVPISQNQFDALVSFSFNVGIEAFKTSTLLILLNKGLFEEVPFQFERWNKAGGFTVLGLIRRRQAESNLFIE